MPNAISHCCKSIAAAGALAAALGWPATGLAQLGGLPALPGLPSQPGGGGASALTGQASAVRVIALGTVTSLADTGTLADAAQPLGTGQALGSIPGLLSAEALHATTMGWSDQAASAASLGNLAMTLAGIGISAEGIQSQALAVAGAAASGSSSVQGLSIGGVPVAGQRPGEPAGLGSRPERDPERAAALRGRHRGQRPARENPGRADRHRHRLGARRHLAPAPCQ